MTKQSYRQKFMQLAKAEPRLNQILDYVDRTKQESRGKEHVCANALWFGWDDHRSILNWMRRLVGWDAHGSAPELRTTEAHDIAKEYLYSRLPACRKCRCYFP